jgi:hypothetical protein
MFMVGHTLAGSDVVLYRKKKEIPRKNADKAWPTPFREKIWIELPTSTTSDGMQWLKMAGLKQSASSGVGRILHH